MTNVTQMNLGLRLKDRGLDAVENSNESWVDTMRKYAVWFSLKAGSVTADNVRQYARNIDFQPDSPNAYGAIFRGKGWKCVGRTKSSHPGNHAREIRVWRYEP